MTTQTVRCLAIMACVLITTVGCGSPQVDGTPSATPPPPTASKSVTSTPTSSPTTEPVPTPTQPSAHDGTDYEACFGGNCEIAVSKPVTITLSDSPIDAGPFTVQKINANSVEVRMALPAGPV